MTRGYRPYLLTDRHYKGGQKILITNTDTHTIFNLLKARFDAGKLYTVVLSNEPFLWVRRLTRSNIGAYTEILLKQEGSDVSTHLAYYYFSGKPWEYSNQYIKLVKYLFSKLNREIPNDILEQLHFRDYVKKERYYMMGILGVLLFFMLVVFIYLVINGWIIGDLFLLLSIAVIVYYVYDLKVGGLDPEEMLSFKRIRYS